MTREYKTMSDTSDEAAKTADAHHNARVRELLQINTDAIKRAEVAEKAVRYWRRCAFACFGFIIGWVMYVVGRI